jgi:hypothetical protein
MSLWLFYNAGSALTAARVAEHLHLRSPIHAAVGATPHEDRCRGGVGASKPAAHNREERPCAGTQHRNTHVGSSVADYPDASGKAVLAEAAAAVAVAALLLRCWLF